MAACRVVAAVVALGVISAGAAGTALAAVVTDLEATVAPTKPGTKQKPRKVAVSATVRSRQEAPSDPVPIISGIDLSMPSELVLGGKEFPSCTEVILRGGKLCNAKSVVGSGEALGRVGPQQLTFQGTVYNGPKGKELLLALEPPAPFPGPFVVTGKWVRGEAGARTLILTFPAELTQGGVSVSQLTLAVKERSVKVRTKGDEKRRSVPFLGLGPCPDGLLTFSSTTSYSGGFPSPSSSATELGCP